MQDVVSIYDDNSSLIQKFIVASLRQIKIDGGEPMKNLFHVFPSLELVYQCDEDFVHTSANEYRDFPYAAGLIAAPAFLLLVFSVFVCLAGKSSATADGTAKQGFL